MGSSVVGATIIFGISRTMWSHVRLKRLSLLKPPNLDFSILQRTNLIRHFIEASMSEILLHNHSIEPAALLISRGTTRFLGFLPLESDLEIDTDSFWQFQEAFIQFSRHFDELKCCHSEPAEVEEEKRMNVYFASTTSSRPLLRSPTVIFKQPQLSSHDVGIPVIADTWKVASGDERMTRHDRSLMML